MLKSDTAFNEQVEFLGFSRSMGTLSNVICMILQLPFPGASNSLECTLSQV